MTTYTVACQDGDTPEEVRSTADFDEAMDWITNAVEAVVDPKKPLTWCTLDVDGVELVRADADGVDNEGEAAPKPKLRSVK